MDNAVEAARTVVTANPGEQRSQITSATPSETSQITAMAPPPQAPAPLYPQYLHQQPQQNVSAASEALAAGFMGLVIVGTGTMGTNLHRVNAGEISFKTALTESVAKGAVGAAAAAGATYTSASLTTGGLLGLAVAVATGTGISYLLTK